MKRVVMYRVIAVDGCDKLYGAKPGETIAAFPTLRHAKDWASIMGKCRFEKVELKPLPQAAAKRRKAGAV